MDQEKVRKALDHFENDEYVDAKEVLSQEIKGAINTHVKDKCDLKNDIDPAPAQDDGADEGEE
jgi:hypothetical protein